MAVGQPEGFSVPLRCVAVVDRQISPELARAFEFLVGRRGNNHPRSVGLGELKREDRDAPGTEKEGSGVWPEASGANCSPGSSSGERGGSHRSILPVRHEVWDDAIANSPAIDALTECGDLAYTIGHRHEGKRRSGMSRKLREAARKRISTSHGPGLGRDRTRAEMRRDEVAVSSMTFMRVLFFLAELLMLF